MELKIDTSKDSKDEIKNIISFLQHFINEPHDHSQIMPEANEDLFSMFADNPPTTPQPENEEPNYQDTFQKDFTITPYE